MAAAASSWWTRATKPAEFPASTNTLSLGLSQTFEGKFRPAPGDSTGREARKIKLLSVQTSSLDYDFEQAKLPGRTGWRTQSLSRCTASSDFAPDPGRESVASTSGLADRC